MVRPGVVCAYLYAGLTLVAFVLHILNSLPSSVSVIPTVSTPAGNSNITTKERASDRRSLLSAITHQTATIIKTNYGNDVMKDCLRDMWKTSENATMHIVSITASLYRSLYQH